MFTCGVSTVSFAVAGSTTLLHRYGLTIPRRTAQAPLTRTTNLEQTRKEPLGFDGGCRNIAITLSDEPDAHPIQGGLRRTNGVFQEGEKKRHLSTFSSALRPCRY